MKIYHPLYGEVEVPEDKDTLYRHLMIAKELLAEEYNSAILAYCDVLEEQLDMERRKKDV